MSFGPYPGLVVSIHDGDTIKVDIDLGFGVWLRKLNARFYGINAPELNTAEGKASRDYLKTLIAPGDLLSVTSYGWDKYGGRFDAELWLPDGRLLNQMLVDAGHARRAVYLADEASASLSL